MQDHAIFPIPYLSQMNRKIRIKHLLMYCVLANCVFITTSCHNQDHDKMLIAVAANAQYAFEEIIDSFEGRFGISCDLIVGSSGKISAQILEGAPFDIFVSADMKFPEKIFANGLAHDTPVIYGEGQIVLWSAGHQSIPSILDLNSSKINHIAIANPAIAPYGVAAVETLEYFELFDQVESKLVYGESIAQVNQFVLSQAVDFGFTAKAAVFSPKLSGVGTWVDVDENAFRPIKQGIVVLKNSQKIDQALTFKSFLTSDPAKRILVKHGYKI